MKGRVGVHAAASGKIGKAVVASGRDASVLHQSHACADDMVLAGLVAAETAQVIALAVQLRSQVPTQVRQMVNGRGCLRQHATRGELEAQARIAYRFHGDDAHARHNRQAPRRSTTPRGERQHQKS